MRISEIMHACQKHNAWFWVTESSHVSGTPFSLIAPGFTTMRLPRDFGNHEMWHLFEFWRHFHDQRQWFHSFSSIAHAWIYRRSFQNCMSWDRRSYHASATWFPRVQNFQIKMGLSNIRNILKWNIWLQNIWIFTARATKLWCFGINIWKIANIYSFQHVFNIK